jgi:hypothetical protein
MARALYGTGAEIIAAALREIPCEDGGEQWLALGVRLDWINEVAIEAQRLTFPHRLRTTITVAASATYYDFTEEEPSCFKLLEVWNGNTNLTDYIIDLLGLRALRSGDSSVTFSDETYYFLAVNDHPIDQNPGLIRMEIYPAVSAAGATLEVLRATAPAEATSLTTSLVYIPKDIMRVGVAWRIALMYAPEKAGVLRTLFEHKCMTNQAAAAMTGRAHRPGVAGYLLGQQSLMNAVGRR